MTLRVRLALIGLRVVSLLFLKRGYAILVISPETQAAWEQQRFEAARLYDKAKAAGVVDTGQYL